MKPGIFLLSLVAAATAIVNAQTVNLSWRVTDQGGGKSTAGELVLRASVGQPAVRKMVHIDTGGVLEAGYIPGLRQGIGTHFSRDLPLTTGWNMVSVPLIIEDSRKTSIFPTGTSSAFGYSGTYRIKDTLSHGTGYWIKSATEQQVKITGTGITLDTISVSPGWNMLGTPSYPILSSSVIPVPPLALLTGFYGYLASDGYFIEDTLKPGAAYWIKTDQPGTLVVRSGSLLLAPLSSTVATEGTVSIDHLRLDRLTFTDANGRSRTLFFTARESDIDLAKFELPPPAPGEDFEVRFVSRKLVEVISRPTTTERRQFPIVLSAGSFPLRITAKLETSTDVRYILNVTGTENHRQMTTEHVLSNSGEIVIEDAHVTGISLAMDVGQSHETPTAFALHQNYPNPFNPSTTIRFEVPVLAHVTLRVYNVLGEEVATLVNRVEEPGYKSITWGASDLPSGVYVVRLSTSGFTESRKLVLAR